ncbi:sugar phosphate isomerase/epimerase family protein [Microlunatus sp. Y2014]|uniref:sugar phosphate isomerase/epimerase family protein n=1 Tax=Microlunatus sp. Y2014 TaxID=3418488 RepID=UPI003DA716AB
MASVVALTLPYTHLDLDRALDGVAAAGFTAIGVGWPHQGVDPLGRGSGGSPGLVRRIADRGLQATVVGLGPAGDASRVDHLRRTIDAAHDLGAPVVQLPGVNSYRRFPDEPIDPAELRPEYQRYVAELAGLADDAAAAGVTLTLKPHTGNTGTGPLLAGVIAEIDHPAVRAAYDPGNVSFYEGLDPVTDIEPVLGVVASLVAKDHRGGRAHADFPRPGEGDVDFPQLFARLRSTGFDGVVVVERVATRAADLADEAIGALLVESRRYLQQLMRQANFGVDHDGSTGQKGTPR